MKKRYVGLAVSCLCFVLLAAGCGTKKSPWSEYVKLGEYKGIEITKESEEVTEEEIKVEMDKVLKQNTSYEQVKAGKVKDGDTVNIDYEGKKDGVAFEGGTAQGYNLIIGSNSFIEGFEAGLLGAEVGKSIDLELTFPAGYSSPDLAGKAVVFTVMVNYIQGAAITPQWNDEFVASISDFATVAEYSENLKKTMAENKKQTAVNNQKFELLEKVVANAEIKSYPEDKITDYVEKMKKEFEGQAAAYGMEYKDLVAGMFGMDEEAFAKEMDKAAHDVVGQNMVLDMIGQKEKIKIDKSKLDADGLAYVQKYGFETVAAFEEQYGVGTVADDLHREMVMNFLMEKAVLVDKPTATAAPEGTATEAPEGTATAAPAVNQ